MESARSRSEAHEASRPLRSGATYPACINEHNVKTLVANETLPCGDIVMIHRIYLSNFSMCRETDVSIMKAPRVWGSL